MAEITASMVKELREATGLAPDIKWPNDLLHEGRKFGGILIARGFERPEEIGLRA